MKRVAIVGCGVVGSSWALVYARAGMQVNVYDPTPAAVQATLKFVADALVDLAAQGLGGDDAPDVVAKRLHGVDSLAAALKDVEYVQESAPERLAIKQALYAELDKLAAPEIIIGSSTSGLPGSTFTENATHRQRCLVVHPINPPHLIPLVELVPTPWTDASVVDRVAELMQQVGQSPVKLTREVNGFLVNRLQSAMLAEAFRLVEDGVCTADDVDKAVADGLGLRWFFMGPFETIDLNAHNGIAEYCKNLGPMYHGLAKEQADPREWSAALVGQVEATRRLTTPTEGLAARRAWRDRCLAALVAAKRKIMQAQRSAT